MMFCPICGADNSVGAKFCGRCGALLADAPGISSLDAGELSARNQAEKDVATHVDAPIAGVYVSTSQPLAGDASSSQRSKTSNAETSGQWLASKIVSKIVGVIIALLVVSIGSTCGHMGSSGSTNAPKLSTTSTAATANTVTSSSSGASSSQTSASSSSAYSGKSLPKEYVAGTIVDNTYYNYSCGFKFALPEGWHFYSQEEIDGQNSKRGEEQIGSDKPRYRMEAGATSGDLYQELDWSVAPIENNRSTGFEHFSSTEIEETRAKYEAEDGVSDVSVEETMISVAGRSAPCVLISFTYMDMPFYEAQVVWVQDDKLVNIGVTCVGENNVQNIYYSIANMDTVERLSFVPD